MFRHIVRSQLRTLAIVQKSVVRFASKNIKDNVTKAAADQASKAEEQMYKKTGEDTILKSD